MVLRTIGSVSVRVDDLSPQEREQINDCFKLLMKAARLRKQPIKEVTAVTFMAYLLAFIYRALENSTAPLFEILVHDCTIIFGVIVLSILVASWIYVVRLSEVAKKLSEHSNSCERAHHFLATLSEAHPEFLDPKKSK